MEAKESIKSEMNINPEVHQGSGVIMSLMAPSRSSIWGFRYVLDPNHQARTSLPTMWRSLLFMVLDHSQWFLWTPWNPRKLVPKGPEWSLRTAITPTEHSVWAAYYGPQTLGCGL
ncbi:hypothetical protein O181_043854 [Austropuccinia psidii MF-1]|uniref:Uncharacterized protein n=1 Tax=Austropuccinia psidii MF-1 TaxID=1389203 RepID=A0A9Q3DIW8_9BASI|nr:hypothetical protein [Austropuccinia psidii MF-1]